MTHTTGAAELPEALDDLYMQLHSISKAMESNGRVYEDEMPEAYGAVLKAMNAVRKLEALRTQPAGVATPAAPVPGVPSDLEDIITAAQIGINSVVFRITAGNTEGALEVARAIKEDLARADQYLLAAAPKPPAAAQEPVPAEAVERIVHLRANREKRIYVAGPMTGLPEFNFPAFNRAAARLRHDGWHVENPAEHGHVEGAGWADYLRWDISRIATCGAIYLLPGWSKSKGASLEVHIAQVLDLRVIFADGAEQPPSPQPAVTAGAVDALRTAAQAVVDRWDTPLWKDAPATAEYIGMLRAALAAQRATHQGDQP